jgi:hypothetical protein
MEWVRIGLNDLYGQSITQRFVTSHVLDMAAAINTKTLVIDPKSSTSLQNSTSSRVLGAP